MGPGREGGERDSQICVPELRILNTGYWDSPGRTYLAVLQLRAVLGQCGVQELVLLFGLDHPAAVGQRRLGADTAE